MKKAYDIVFSDIDGTLVNDEHLVTPKTAEKIRELTNNGVPFILVSARPPMGVKHAQYMLGIDSPMICFCGGVIVNTDGSIIKDDGIPMDTAVKIKRFFDENYPDICVCSYLYDRWLCDDKEHFWVKYETGVTAMQPEEKSLYELKEPCIHKFLCMGDPTSAGRAEKDLRDIFDGDAAIYRSKREYIEITPKGVSKSAAMRELCRIYGTAAERTLAFGDNYNDLDMLKAAGLSVAMGNAPEEIKAACGMTTGDNNSDGIYSALTKIFG